MADRKVKTVDSSQGAVSPLTPSTTQLTQQPSQGIQKTKAKRKKSKQRAASVVGTESHAATMPGEIAEPLLSNPAEHTTELVSPRAPKGEMTEVAPPGDHEVNLPSRDQSSRTATEDGKESSGLSEKPEEPGLNSAASHSRSASEPEAAVGTIWQPDGGAEPEFATAALDGTLELSPRQESEHKEEAMPGQSEINFPTSLVHTTSPGQHTRPAPVIQNLHHEERDFDSLDPKDYGIQFEDEEMMYERPERDVNLPDLYRLMASLEAGESDLDSQREPPSLFTQPEHVPRYKKISELKLRLEEDDIAPYVDEFEEGVRDDVLMIGSITLEDIQEEEKRLRDEHIAYEEQEAAVARDRQQEVIVKEEEAKKRVARDLKEKRRLIKRHEVLVQQKERLMLDRVHKAFRRSENQLVSALKRRKGEVTTMYGDLVLSDGHYGGSKGRRWKVDWEKTPQPIQIKLCSLRGVRDKLPRGRYVMMVSLCNRLGGHVMRWSSLRGQQWGGTTLPVHHDGNFYNSEIKIDQSVFTVLPSKPGIRPGMVLVFELFLLRGATVPTDRVVSWGCFPVTNGKFDVIEGKYKTCFLRGEMDPRIDKHEKLEELISSDIDHWLSNLYFEIIKLPRYLAGQKEYEVELQFTSGLLSYPDRVNMAGEEYRDGEVPIPGSLPDVSASELSISNNPSESNLTAGQLMRSTANLEGRSSENLRDEESEKLPPYTSDFNTPLGYKIKRAASVSSGSAPPEESSPRESLNQQRPMTTIGSRRVHKDRKVKLSDADGSEGSDYEEEDIYLSRKDNGIYPVKGQPGMFYKKYANSPVDEYHEQLYTLLPKTPILTRKKRRKRQTYQEQLEEHSFAVMDRLSEKGHLSQSDSKKVSYVRRQFLAELGLSQWRSSEFWGMIIMFILVFFLRLYLHYIGQWLLLQGLAIPINRFNFLPYTVSLNYQSTLLTTREEIGIVLIGPFFIILLFALLVFIVWILQRLIGSIPDIASKFVIVFGIEAFLDWLLVLIIDAALQRYRNLGGDNPIADFAKLYWNFDTAEGSGLAGVFITIFLYMFCCFTAGAILYMYFLRLHNNGRMLDIYWRLHGAEDVFFVPYDLEVSNQELSYIVKHAEQWRGQEGERRKVAVYDYIWEEEDVEETVWDENGVEHKEVTPGTKEVTTHVSIHTIHLDGLRELHRHFLRLPDGAVVEVLGGMDVAGMDKDMKGAISVGTHNLENVNGSRRSLSKVRGRETAFTNAGFTLDNEDTTIRNERPLSGTSSTSSVHRRKSTYREVTPDKI